MHHLLQKLMLGGSTAALVSAASLASAWAQGSDTDIEQVVVSASRITIAGYQQPTPVTVVGAAQLEKDAYANVTDAIRDLPSVATPPSSESYDTAGVSAGQEGENLLNLRNLGILRTLVLFDGQRVVQSNITGGVDLSTIPTSLVERIDIVTGGASAAWGSDAVAGVVNLVLNKNFTGFKANIEGTDTSNGLYRGLKTEGAWGGDFGDGRGHFIISADYSMYPDAVPEIAENWFNDTYLVNNPAYNAVTNPGVPQQIHANNVGFSQVAAGGLITASPAGTGPGAAPANALRGIQFVGSGANEEPFNFGNITGALSNGGSGNLYNTEQVWSLLAIPGNHTTVFGFARYKVTPDIQASLQLNYGFFDGKGYAKSDISNAITIQSDNAYIPAAVRSEMTAGGITSFTIGSLQSNNYNMTGTPAADYFADSEQDLAPVVAFNHRQLMRGVFTLEGPIGENWSWNVYYQHGEVRYIERTDANPLTARETLAADAVTVTAANRGTSGLPLGSIACRDTLTTPTDGCIPLDVFGVGVASPGAIAYVAPPLADFEHMITNEDVASGSMQGTLPWELPAGPVAIAFGAEYRKEGGRNTADPRGASASWGSGNFTNFAGEYNIYEGFAEVDAPLIKGGDWVQSLDFNGAGRMTSYSTSGLVETWKLGLTSQVNDDVRLRTTWSVDIRAPSLTELFNPAAINQGSSVDPRAPTQTVRIYTDAIGNAALVPETSRTISGGIVLTPRWVPGLTVSADWYSISISQAIASVGATQIVSTCEVNPTNPLCSQLIFNGTEYPGALSEIITQPVNAASQTTSGLDFQADYAMDVFGGTLNWHAVGNYTDEETQVLLGVRDDYAGSLGGNSAIVGTPKFKATVSATYAEGAWSGTVQTRLIGAAINNNAWTSGVQVDDNSVPFVAYLDLRAAYKWNDNIGFYAAVDNLTDVPPPEIPINATVNDYTTIPTSSTTYDLLGRVFRAGIRFTY